MITLEYLTIRSVEDTLKFKETGAGFYTALMESFNDYVQKKYDILLAKIAKHSQALYEEINEKKTLIIPANFDSMLLSPEFLGITLKHSEAHIDKVGEFINTMLDAEIARQQEKFDTSKHSHLWTGNGDYFIYFDPEKEVFEAYEAPKINDTITYDFLSPACLQVNNETLNDDHSIVANYGFDDAPLLYDKINDAMAPVDDRVLTLIMRMTRMIIVKKQLDKDTKEAKFWSATHSNYIGKILLVNPDVASPEDIIDGLVHEAVHSLLYIIEELNPWMPSEEISVKIGNQICSPWTNNMLPLRAFLHALFVWYSLFNLWVYARENNLYDQADVKKRIKHIRAGYAEINIRRDIIDAYQLELNDELVQTIENMQEYVLTH